MAADVGLRDNPIESTSTPVYLDGAWTASTLPPLDASPSGSPCFFTMGTDFNHGKKGHRARAISKEDCCAQCSSRAGCAASVFADGNCWFKDDIDLAKPYACDNCVSCVLSKWPHVPVINITIPATVPGDLITDLQRAKVISDPWRDLTWIQQSSLWTDHAWTYTTHFTVENSALIANLVNSSLSLLVFEGVKMGAMVRVNGQVVAVLRDQFLRYQIPLSSNTLRLFPGHDANRLDITFGVENVPEDGRFMACTGGWDWAPYSYTDTNSSGSTSGPANSFSKGFPECSCMDV